jgi:glutaredoxin
MTDFRALIALLCAVVLALLVGPATPAQAAAQPTAQEDDVVELVLFWGVGCPHCADEKEWLATAVAEYPQLQVTEYEVWYDEANRRLLMRTAQEMGFEPSGVPVTVIGDRHWIGWSDGVRSEIEAILAAGAGPPEGPAPPSESSTIDVPLVGDVTVSSDSLVLSTLVIGFVDGVNPCSLWVVSVLLAIVIRTGSRGRVLAIGGTFLVVTAAMYAIYIVGIYSAMSVVGRLGAVQVVVALVAGVLGLVSVKDYFAFRKGVSFTIQDSAKPGLYRRMRDAAGHRDLAPALAATVVLAVGVSLLETPCTAGFPVLWTGLLEANGVSTAEAAGLFGLYMLPFLADELLVFGVAVVTLRATKLQEHHGRVLKLFAGVTMLALAVTVLVAPEVMTEPIAAGLLFVGALTAAGIVHLVTRALATVHH